jgi:tetratricopeptide (TPR) repeat protein
VRWIAMSAAAGMVCAGAFLCYAHSHARPRNAIAEAPVTTPTPAPVPAPAALAAPPAAAVAPAVLPDSPVRALPAPAASPSPGPLSPTQEAAGAELTQRESLAACRQAHDRRRSKDVLAECARAFAEDPSSEVATWLAQTELDRGRARQALDWAKKAVTMDENRADAYVFLGGAEQTIGHAAAAKTAYRRYLQLSPQGRYAAELRSVLASL